MAGRDARQRMAVEKENVALRTGLRQEIAANAPMAKREALADLTG